MCKKLKGIHNRIDKCMKPLIAFLKREGYDTRGCCCGHGKYPMTVLATHPLLKGQGVELLSGTLIQRKRIFYKRDKQGYYFIPEVIENATK